MRITRISQTARQPRRRNIYLDGKLAFWLYANIVEQAVLQSGTELTDHQLAAIQNDQLQQVCFDRAIKFISKRTLSSAQLKIKLLRAGFEGTVVETTIARLETYGYVNDTHFAGTVAARHQDLGKSGLLAALEKAGIEQAIADHAVKTMRSDTQDEQSARNLANRLVKQLETMPLQTGRRRMAHFLARRGFNEEIIERIVNDLLPEHD